MAPLEQHVKDCIRYLGDGHAEVHDWIDQHMRHLGSAHRKVLHHTEGIEEAKRLFGEGGRRAAVLHILRDCRNIPRKADYENGTVDVLGLRKDWPIAAYALYNEEAFEALMNYELNGPVGSLLWGFVGNRPEDIANLWTAISRGESPDTKLDLDAWGRAKHARAELSPIEPLQKEEVRPIEGAALQQVLQLTESEPNFKESIQSMLAQGVEFAFTWLPVSKLACPIALINFEHVEELRAELSGDDEASIVRFAFHGGGPKGFKANLTGRNLVITSRHLGATLSPPRVEPDGKGGVSIRVDVGVVAEFIHVFVVGTRLYLANGIHRSYFLSSVGKTEVPCLMMKLGSPPAIESAFPTFAPPVMLSERPPLLNDFFNKTLATVLPIQRNQKVLRVTTEEFPVPSL